MPSKKLLEPTLAVVTNSPTVKTVPNKNKSKQKPPLDDIGYSLEPKSVFRDRSWNIVKLDKTKFITK
jgi:hypothetical protein